MTAAIRDFLGGEGFLEIETPMLSRSTPEGARDFLVPSRREPGSFYALPQSPQLFKQLLMVAGFERYFQIARCFRDEDQRADRQPDFTQLDLEMSFVGVEDVLDLNERLLASVFERVGGPALELPLPRLAYADAIERFGTDRPDLRFGLELRELTDLLAQTEFKVFRGAIEAGGIVKGINAGAREVPRSVLDGLIERAQELGAKGLVWAFREGDGWRSPTAKFLADEELAALNQRLEAAEGDLLLVVADRPEVANAVLAQLRLDLGARFELIDAEAEDVLLGRPSGRCSAGTKTSSAGTRSTIRSPPRPASSTPPPPARRWRSPTTWSGTARSSAAARSGSRTPSSSRGCWRRSGSPPRGGSRALRLPARGAALRGAAARRDRLRARSDRPAPRARRLDPRRDRLPEGRLGRRPADRRSGARR